MKYSIPTTREVNITQVLIEAPVYHGDEEMPTDFPLRDGDKWTALVDLATGKIQGWPEGREESVYLTVRDAGKYSLIDETRQTVAKIENNYVPNQCIPGEFGDTIELDIAPDGTITNWPKSPDLSEFFPKEGD